MLITTYSKSKEVINDTLNLIKKNSTVQLEDKFEEVLKHDKSKYEILLDDNEAQKLITILHDAHESVVCKEDRDSEKEAKDIFSIINEWNIKKKGYCITPDKRAELSVDVFKYLGNIRFVMLPLFFTAMGAISVGYWKISTATSPDESLSIIVIITGMLISLLFGFYEWQYSKASWKASKLLPKCLNDLEHKGRSEKGNTHWGWITLVTFGIYSLPFLFGIAYLAYMGHTHCKTRVPTVDYYLTGKCVNVQIKKVPNKNNWLLKFNLTVEHLKKLNSDESILWQDVNFVVNEKKYKTTIYDSLSNPIDIEIFSEEKKAEEAKKSIMEDKNECRRDQR